MRPQITYSSIQAFDKNLKRLTQKFCSLPEDLDLAKRAAIELFHLKKINNRAIFPIPGFCSDTFRVYKIKKFACRSLKGRGSKSGIRIIYFFDIQKLEVVFIEIYFKCEQESEDQLRIKDYLKIFAANTKTPR